MGIFDSHAHLDDEKFDNDREELIKKLKTNGVEFVVNPADRLESGLKALEIAKKYDFIYAALGVHPHEVKHTNDDQLRKIEDLAKNNKKVVAIGEIGLDYYYENSDRDTQKEYFRKQLDIAVKINKPVIIHSREATGDMYNILREYKGKIKGVMHCYSGSMEMAKEFIKLGFFISIGGVVTFKNAKTPKIVAKDIDLDYLLIETDSPYLSPEPFRGKRNEPKNTLYVAEKIAELRDMKVLDIIDITRKNAMKLFGIKK